MKSFSFHDRQKKIDQLSSLEFDLLIIGGGITGAGVARDAAMRGMKVALVEASDFASGTSSRSSKLVHGGIRYLENMEFKLVFEALSERQKLFEIAPHLVHPLRFMIPLYKGGRVGMGMMGLGMWLYDALSLFQAPEMHERLDANATLKRMPTLQADDLLGSFVYSDAYMDDDRLAIETLRSANEFGAICINYVKAIGVKLNQKNEVELVQCEDGFSQKKFSIKAKHFVSCVGPWTDQLGKVVDSSWKKMLRPTKGIHLTFEKKRLQLESAVVMAAEKRIVFGIPRHEMVIVGTTDTDFNQSPEQVQASPEDVQYLLDVTSKYFPGAKITGKDIVASYAGVRPLVHDGSENEGKTSREHVIKTDASKVTYVAGGKYTTYRLMAQQIVEECLKYFDIERRVQFNRCRTTEPINPAVTIESRGQDFLIQEDLVSVGVLSENEARSLVDRHGAESAEIWKRFGKRKYWATEVAHAIENTMCSSVLDFYTRRSPLILSRPDHGLSVLEEISTEFASNLGWNEARKKQEQENLKEYIAREFAWRHKIT